MADRVTTFGDTSAGAASNVAAKLGDTAAQVRDQVDTNRQSAAQGLEQAASTIRDKAPRLPGGERVTDLAHTAADKLTATAGYVREHDVNTMVADVEALVKNNPGPALLAAAVVGFLVGRAFSGTD
jgi:ElaB/YqjD/DUF883 family membrane-anchored ribosome-binding protein